MSTTAFSTPTAHLAHNAFEHEQLLVHQDPFSGLKVVIALHSTAMGPALGGTRFLAYARDEDAVSDALQLSRGMSYKNALSGVAYGGGKAVIIGDPARAKTEELLLAYGRCVASLGGRYITGCDVGTFVTDMDVVARTCEWVAGRSPRSGGAGDSSILAAFGVYQAMRAAAQHRWGDASLRGKLVGVCGVGKVGHLLVGHLVKEGARVTVTDIDRTAVRKVSEEFPTVTVAADTAALVRTEGMDVYAPCALGGALDRSTVPALTAEVVCGAANNQLAYAEADIDLVGRGVLYVPDYVANAGGAIQAAGAVDGADFEKRRAQTERIFTTTLTVLRHAEANDLPPGAAADRIAEERINAAAHARVRDRGATAR
ncbi:Glu/Leu/Phe/Val dehydrogenase dimerization domain-containing protein [Streptomyces sp. NPDC091272]|uniref:Glu/Leu/Phe/Val dehydrogenase dimerization domain-containing protein n=1 Tax=Streptomyces sp. NPDC091272 TaxID=3365981 RepID=UPI00382BA325